MTPRGKRTWDSDNVLSVQRPGGQKYAKLGFLSEFDESNPIVVIVTPLRKSQGKVLQRNLQKAGAQVASADELQCLNKSSAKHITVVTDDRRKAYMRLPAWFRDADKGDVSFVSTKWASTLLSSQKYVPQDGFILPDDESLATCMSEGQNRFEVATLRQSPTPSSPYTSPNGPPPYVWCGEGVTDSSDAKERQALLRRIPALQCERPTLCAQVYVAPNDELCNLLDNIGRKRQLETVQAQDEEMRARAYYRASAALRCVPFRLRSADEADSIHGVGQRALTAIREYLGSGTIAEASHVSTVPRLRALDELSQLYGVGLKTARRLHDDERISSTADLRSRLVEDPPKGLTQACLLFLQWESRLTKARRDLVRRLCDRVVNVMNKDTSLAVRAVVCGGLRRGKLAGHDADIVYCRRKGKSRSNTDSIMHVLLHRLTTAKLLRVVLHESSDISGRGDIRHFGRGRNGDGQVLNCNYAFAHDVTHAIAELDGELFRADFVGVRDADEMCYATLAWSGSTAFQRDLRITAERRGWIFNDHGIFDRASGERVNLTPQPQTEMDVFVALGLTYRPPFERCS